MFYDHVLTLICSPVRLWSSLDLLLLTRMSQSASKKIATVPGIGSGNLDIFGFACCSHRVVTNFCCSWGPYLSERQWGTVREDYSVDGINFTRVFLVLTPVLNKIWSLTQARAGNTSPMISLDHELIVGEKMVSWEFVIVNVALHFTCACGMAKTPYWRRGYSGWLTAR